VSDVKNITVSADNPEIQLARQEEAFFEASAIMLDRMATQLVPWPRTIVVAHYLPPGSWCNLPEGWQTMTSLALQPYPGIPPWRGKSDIAVSLQTAERMIKMLKEGYRG
jgi:hypothetical protein